MPSLPRTSTVLGMSQLVELSRIRALVRSGAARSIREGAGISLAEIAREVGVAVATVWRWEHGQRQPRGEAALRYGRVLEELTRR